MLEPADVAKRWPQIDGQGLGPAVFEPHAGVLRARFAVRTAVRVATEHYDVEYRTARIASLDESRASIEAKTTDGVRVDADAYVITDLPDASSGIAVSLAVNASGAVRLTTIPLITPEEIDAACKKTVVYRAPGA